MTIDKRLHAVRTDLADARLKGAVEAARFVTGKPARVAIGILPLKEAPHWEAPLSTELFFGDAVTVFEEKDGWAWLQAEADDYVGYAPLEGIEEGAGPAPTHRVTALATFLYAEPDLKSMPLDSLPLGADLTLSGEEQGTFRAAAGEGWVFAPHVTPRDALSGDFVREAERFLGIPYLWGGKSSRGIDCSGLVQVALRAVGSAAPRDTDMQAKGLGSAADPKTPRRRGDLLYFPGHVGIATDAATMLHANARSMTVASEPLTDVIARIGPPVSVRAIR
jgi:hypothetical protein